MAKHIQVPAMRVSTLPMTPEKFAPFGTVIMNPLAPHEPRPENPPTNAVYANQGSAVKFLDVTAMTNYYDRATSKKAGTAVMNMFSCAPRKLRLDKDASLTLVESRTVSFGEESEKRASTFLFDVGILERHPYTFQTFVPMALDRDDSGTAYLVIVAPTLPSPGDEDHPKGPKGPGLPDFENIKAFVTRGNQAVTYGAGTWHAPMVVLGSRPVDFVVVQFANGVADDDCQEVELHAKDGEEGIAVELKLARKVEGKSLASAVKARL